MSDQPRLAMIAARARNGVIGREGGLPWRLSSDLKAFKRITMNKPLLMGRKTWQSLPGVLPGRPHLVLTRDANFASDGAEVRHSLDSLIERGQDLARERGVDEVMIIGGGELYRLALPQVQRIYLTEVNVELDGDAHFPELDDADWREIDREHHDAGPKDDFAFTVRTLERIAR